VEDQPEQRSKGLVKHPKGRLRAKGARAGKVRLAFKIRKLVPSGETPLKQPAHLKARKTSLGDHKIRTGATSWEKRLQTTLAAIHQRKRETSRMGRKGSPPAGKRGPQSMKTSSST